MNIEFRSSFLLIPAGKPGGHPIPVMAFRAKWWETGCSPAAWLYRFFPRHPSRTVVSRSRVQTRPDRLAGDSRMLAIVPLFFGHWEILLVALIALLLFGNRLPSIMRSMGLSITEFKKGVKGVEDDVNAVEKDRT
jgi:sec-independent protein translocase protein TatA